MDHRLLAGRFDTPPALAHELLHLPLDQQWHPTGRLGGLGTHRTTTDAIRIETAAPPPVRCGFDAQRTFGEAERKRQDASDNHGWRQRLEPVAKKERELLFGCDAQFWRNSGAILRNSGAILRN